MVITEVNCVFAVRKSPKKPIRLFTLPSMIAQLLMALKLGGFTELDKLPKATSIGNGLLEKTL